MATSRANSEVEEKCSLSRLLSEPFPNGLFLLSNLPAGCSHHLSEGHLAAKTLSCPNRQELYRSLQLPPNNSTSSSSVGLWRYKVKPAIPGPLAPLASHPPEGDVGSLPLPYFLAGTLQATSKSCQRRAVFSPDNLHLISKWRVYSSYV